MNAQRLVVFAFQNLVALFSDNTNRPFAGFSFFNQINGFANANRA